MSGCTASMCTKYVPGEHRARLKQETTLDDDDIRPRRVRAHGDVVHPVPPSIRQFPRVDPDAPAPAFNNTGAASANARLHGTSPRPQRPAPPGHKASPSLPASYESHAWQSVTKAEFPGRAPEVVSKELQQERANAMRLSSVKLAETGMRLGAMGVHSKDALPRYDPEWYARRGQRTNAIGGPHEKCTSAVSIAGAGTGNEDVALTEQHYETMSRRQFTVHGAGHNAAKCKANQQDMQRSHWSIGFADPRAAGDGPRCSVAKAPLPTLHVKVKGKEPEETAAAEPFRPRSAKDARPDPTLQEAARAALLRSSVPLMGAPGNAVGPTDVPERALDVAAIPTRNLTSTASVFPRYDARPAQPVRVVGDPTTEGSSGLTMGADQKPWVTSQKSHYRGVWIG